MPSYAPRNHRALTAPRAALPALRAALLSLALLLPLAPLAGAAQVAPIEARATLLPGATVELTSVTHGWEFRPASGNELTITGEYDTRVFELLAPSPSTTPTAAYRLEIRGREGVRNAPRPQGNQRIIVELPAGVRLDLSTVSGPVQLRHTGGSVTAHTVSGAISASGEIPSVQLESVSGRVAFEGTGGEVRLRSVSGAVRHQGTSEALAIRTVSGSLSVTGAVGAIEAQTVSGGIALESTLPLRTLRAESVSGRVRFSGAIADGGTVEMESQSGGIELALTRALDARYLLRSLSGSVRADLPGAPQPTAARGMSRVVDFTTGSGAARVELRSFSGSVRVTGP